MAADKTKQVLVIYPGRFQPFHKGHKMAFEYLNSKYENVFVATSDKVDPPRSPFSFEEKKKMMELTGMDTTNVVMTKSPYVAMEITQNFDMEKTILMFAISEKDMAEDPRFTFKPKKDGSPSYFQAAPKDGTDMETMDKHGYMITVPTFNFNVLGKPMTSATEVRSSFASMDEETKKKLITDLFGNYSDEVFDLMNGKIIESEQHGNHPHRVFAGLDSDIRNATEVLEDLFIKVKDSPIGTKVRANFMIQFHGALNALKQQMQINLELRENYGLDKISFPDIITLKRKQNTYNLSITESNNKIQIKVLETGKTLPVRNLIKLYERGYRKLEETKKMSSQKLGTFAKGKSRVSIWETDGEIVMYEQRSRRLQETKGSVKQAVDALYARGYVCESVDMTSLKNQVGAIMNVFHDTIKNTTTVRDQKGGEQSYQATGQQVIAALQKKGFMAQKQQSAPQRDVWDQNRDASGGAEGGLSMVPKDDEQQDYQTGMHGKMLNAEKDSKKDWDKRALELMAARGQLPKAQKRIRSRKLKF